MQPSNLWTPPCPEEWGQDAPQATKQNAISEFEKGQNAHQRGDLQTAIAHYNVALDIIRDFPEALYQRGMAYLALKQLEAARADLLRVVGFEGKLLPADGKPISPQLGRFFSRAYSALADIFTQNRNLTKAEQFYRRALQFDPRLQRARTSLVNLLIEREAYDEAATHLRTVVEAGGADASTYNLLGYVSEQLHQPDQAMESYSKAIEQDPSDRLARDRRSHLRAQRQDYQAAIEDFKVVYQQDSSAAHARRLAVLYERADEPGEAISMYERAIEGMAPSAETKSLRLKIIDLLTSTDRPQEVLPQLEKLVQENPNDADAHARLARHVLPDDPARAAEAYLRAAKLDRDNVDYQVGISAALLKLKRYQEALNISLGAFQQAPENYYVRSNLATAYYKLKAFAQAAEHFKWITAHRPEAAVPYYFLGICYDQLMEYELALNPYEKFLALADPSQHQMEIDNVKFRLPGLRRAIKKGRGRRR